MYAVGKSKAETTKKYTYSQTESGSVLRSFMEPLEDDIDQRQTNPDFNFKSLIPCVKSKSKKVKEDKESKSDTHVGNTGASPQSDTHIGNTGANPLVSAFTTPTMDSTDCKSEDYIVKSGVCIVICNGEFANAQERKGAWWDGRLASDVFEKLGFEVVYLFNKESEELLESLEKVVKGEETVGALDQYDCLVVIISSHGSEDQTCSDNDEVKRYTHMIDTHNGKVETDRIIRCFDRCQPLEGKPKLFFIQACRTRMTDDKSQFIDTGVEITLDKDSDKRQIDSFYNKISTQDAVGAMPQTIQIGNTRYDEHTPPTPQPEDMVEAVVTPCYTDCLLMFASPSGKFAWSDYYSGNQYRRQGGWLLMSLYSTLMPKIQKGKPFEILEVLTEVCQEMAQNYETTGNKDFIFNELVSVPCISHMLMKDVYFNPK